MLAQIRRSPLRAMRRWPSCRCPWTECGNAPCANRGHGPLPQRLAEFGSRGKNNGAATNRLQAGSYATLVQIRRSPLAGDASVAILQRLSAATPRIVDSRLSLPSDRVWERAMRANRGHGPLPQRSAELGSRHKNNGAATNRLQAGSYAMLAQIRRSPLAGDAPVAILQRLSAAILGIVDSRLSLPSTECGSGPCARIAGMARSHSVWPTPGSRHK